MRRSHDFSIYLFGSLAARGHSASERPDRQLWHQHLGRLWGNPDRPHELYWNFWVELGWRIGWLGDATRQLRSVGQRFEHRRRLGRNTDRTYHSNLAPVRRSLGIQSRHGGRIGWYVSRAGQFGTVTP